METNNNKDFIHDKTNVDSQGTATTCVCFLHIPILLLSQEHHALTIMRITERIMAEEEKGHKSPQRLLGHPAYSAHSLELFLSSANGDKFAAKFCPAGSVTHDKQTANG